MQPLKSLKLYGLLKQPFLNFLKSAFQTFYLTHSWIDFFPHDTTAKTGLNFVTPETLNLLPK